MAVRIGQANDHIDLWDTLLDFLQNDPDLVASGQNWTTVWQHSERPDQELVLRGPGISGGNEVLVGLNRADETLSALESAIYLCGMTGVLPGAERYYDHINSLARRPSIFLDHGPMKYWMVANGRRFVVVLNISTIYQAMYGGFFLPYANPTAYPYPLFIGGTRSFSGGTGSYAPPVSWRDTGRGSYRHFVSPYSASLASSSWYDSQAFLLDPSGGWRAGTNSASDPTESLPRLVMGPPAFPGYMGGANVYPAGSSSSRPTDTTYALGYAAVRNRIFPGLNGEMPLTPASVLKFEHSTVPDPTHYGVLDGVYDVPGVGNAAENIISVNGVDHLVVQNVERTGQGDYWALALE